jgi:ActR/RegA family two-component response regulator
MAKTYEILIVDDDRFLREELENYLKRSSGDFAFHVTIAENYESALEKLNENSFDGVILDLLFPKEGEEDANAGAKLLEEMRKYAKDAAIVILTGYATVDRAAQLTKRGACKFIQKPVKPKDFEKTLQHAIEQNELQKRINELTMEFIELGVTDAILDRIANSLNNIVGEAERIIEDLKKAKEKSTFEFDERMGRIVEIAEQTINEALKQAGSSIHHKKTERGKVDIRRVLERCKELLDDEYGTKNIIIEKVPEVDVIIESYPETVAHMFYLLIEGTCEATAPDSKVEFSINNTEENRVEVKITYSGPPMSESPNRSNRLSIGKKLLKELLGDMKIESQSDKETEVIITIPSLENIIV